MGDTTKNLISIADAAKQGITRLRKPIWASQMDHLRIDILDGAPGPWTRLYCPVNVAYNGRDPVNLLCISMDYSAKEWEPYTGPLPDSEEYKSAQGKFVDVFARTS